jgi:asparagine synthase (glutamine-hydrolysing)
MMCGIAGILNFNKSNVQLENIQLMTTSMRRRGPDDEGICFFAVNGECWILGSEGTSPAVMAADGPYFPSQVFRGNVPADAFLALGHRRLSILDLSPAGHQPMCTEDQRYWMVYNGEIYNYREIRDTMKKGGERFNTNTDTEVFLKAFRKWGLECVNWFNGMWAAAIWDNQEKVLYCTRDRIGIKPFYYFNNDQYLIFASDIKTLIASGLYFPEPDWQGVYHAMSFYCAPRPLTCFKGVRALEQAHWLMVSSNGEVRKQRFWQLPVGQVEYGKSERQWLEELEEAIRLAVRRRLVADVPLGTFMSGGIDSTTMSAIAAQEHPGIKAFTLAYEESAKEFDELPSARATASRYPLQHIIKKVVPEQCLPNLLEMTRCYEEPFYSIAPNYVISQLVAENQVTVILNGLGPDETLCGYGRDHGLNLWTKIHPWHRALSLWPAGIRKIDSLKDLAGLTDISDYYVFNFSTFTERQKQDLFASPQTREWNSYTTFKELYGLKSLAFSDNIEALCYLDLINYIGNHHVYRVDQFTMHFSLEGRFPYLDYELIELCARIPSSLKKKNGLGKYPLRQIAQKYIDPSCLTMNKKGFGLPVEHWMRGTLKPLVQEKINGLKMRGILKNGIIDNMLQGFYVRNNNYQQLWFLVSLELWLEAFID